MNYLCCCQGGKVRSVATKYLLNDTHGIQTVLTCGLENTDSMTLMLLSGWADVIVVSAAARIAKLVPRTYRNKLVVFDIGDDVWHHYHHPDLLAKLRPLVKQLVADRGGS